MSKVDDNKKQKESTLLETAFHLFTGKGFAKTTISDIVQQAGLAKGTFYLYFKDKYDLRDKLIVYKANQLFDDAHRALEKANVSSFEDELLFTTDYIIERFQKNHFFMEFIAKNLSWGIFKKCLYKRRSFFLQPILRSLHDRFEKIQCKLPCSGTASIHDDRTDRLYKL